MGDPKSGKRYTKPDTVSFYIQGIEETKKYTKTVLLDLGDNEKMKELGFIFPQDILSHNWLKRRLDATPNHCEIKARRH
ncbi:hypothetical protein LguiA_025808 [Lonicera macranthoides]